MGQDWSASTPARRSPRWPMGTSPAFCVLRGASGCSAGCQWVLTYLVACPVATTFGREVTSTSDQVGAPHTGDNAAHVDPADVLDGLRANGDSDLLTHNSGGADADDAPVSHAGDPDREVVD